jgi:hypothetical protein
MRNCQRGMARKFALAAIGIIPFSPVRNFSGIPYFGNCFTRVTRSP